MAPVNAPGFLSPAAFPFPNGPYPLPNDAPAQPAPYLIGQGFSNTSVTSLALTVLSPVSAGDAIVVVSTIGFGTFTAAACSDTRGNSYGLVNLGTTNVVCAQFAASNAVPLLLGDSVTVSGFNSHPVLAMAVGIPASMLGGTFLVPDLATYVSANASSLTAGPVPATAAPGVPEVVIAASVTASASAGRAAFGQDYTVIANAGWAPATAFQGAVAWKLAANGIAPGSTVAWTQQNAGNSALLYVTLRPETRFTPKRPPDTPPGFSSPGAWQAPPYLRLGQTPDIIGSGGVVLPKPSLAGSGAETSVPTVLPASPLLPPGLASPAAWQYPQYRPLLTVTTIAGSGAVILPKPSLSGSGTETSVPTVLPASPLMPPGLASPAAWQYPRYQRLGQVVTIAGSGGVTLPKPSLSDSGAETTVPTILPASPLLPPGLSSPAAWQYPRYQRLGQVVTIAGSGGVTLPKPSLAGQGTLTVPFILPAAPLMPPGLSSPAAWQTPPYRRAGQTVPVFIPGSGGVVLPKPSLAGAARQLPRVGSWWGLDSIFKQSRSEFDAFVSRPPVACPNCGEPLSYAPATRAGSGVERYCKFDGFQYPRDYIAPQRPW